MSSITPEKAHGAIDKAAQEKFGDRSTQITEKYSDLSAQGKEYVKNNPGSALLAAVGVGFILAKLLGGSSDRSDYRDDYRNDYRKDYNSYRD